MWNKVLLVLIYLVVFCSGAGHGLVRWRLTGSGASNFGDSCVETFGCLSAAMVLASLRGESHGSMVVRYDCLALYCLGL
jgi:hypothetical protein